VTAATVVRWSAPGLQRGSERDPAPAPPDVAAIQAIEQAAYDEGRARGHAEGLASGQLEMRRLLAQMEGILDGFTRPLARLDAEVGEALGELAVRIAGALIGRAYAADATLLADLVREALDMVGSSSREVELRLHPDDMGMLALHLAGLDGVRLSHDNTLARGELRLHSENVRIDGSLTARLNACLQALLDAQDARP